MGKRPCQTIKRATESKQFRFKETGRIPGAGTCQDHLQDMRAVLYNLLESEKQKAILAKCKRGLCLEVIDPAVAPEIGKSQSVN